MTLSVCPLEALAEKIARPFMRVGRKKALVGLSAYVCGPRSGAHDSAALIQSELRCAGKLSTWYSKISTYSPLK